LWYYIVEIKIFRGHFHLTC